MPPGPRTLATFAAAATLVAVLAATAAGTPAARCTVAVGRDAVASLEPRPRIPGLDDSSVAVSPKEVDGALCLDLTRDGKRDLALTVASGGTAGDIGWLVLAGSTGGYRLVHAGGGYKLGLVRLGGDVVETEPLYRKNDPNCCPTGGFDHARWHWSGRKLVVVHRWHDRSYRS